MRTADLRRQAGSKAWHAAQRTQLRCGQRCRPVDVGASRLCGRLRRHPLEAEEMAIGIECDAGHAWNRERRIVLIPREAATDGQHHARTLAVVEQACRRPKRRCAIGRSGYASPLLEVIGGDPEAMERVVCTYVRRQLAQQLARTKTPAPPAIGRGGPSR